jgi:glycosyltransferase involved in cell wall biosynthesis
MSRLRILQLFSRYLQYGGEEGCMHRIAEALGSRHEVENFIEASEDLLKLPKWRLPLVTYRNGPVLDRLAERQAAGKFDFWQIHNVFPAISPGAYTLAAKLGVPIVHYLHNYRMGCANGAWFVRGEECRKCAGGNFIHGAIGRCWRGSLSQSTAMALLLADVRRRGLFDQVRRWVAISHAQKALHVGMGLPEDRIDVVHHFMDHDSNAVVPELPTNGHALFIGRLSPEKGVDRLLDAWARLDRSRKLVIAGDGPELAALRAKAASLGLDDGRVRFAGFVDPAGQNELWAGAAFSVVPSIWQEPFGMVVLESWACGRAVVGHRIGALPELIRDGETGFLADPGDAGDLANVLESAFNADRDTLMEMGRAGRSQLVEQHSRAHWMEEIEQVYRNAGLLS